MKKYINLLPPEEQQKIKLAKLTNEIFNFALWVGLSLVIFILLAFASVVYLKNLSGSFDSDILHNKLVLQSSDNDRIRQEVSALNTAVKDFQNLKAQHYHWSEALVALAQIIPREVQLNGLSLDRKTGKVEILGEARNRETVIALWVALKRSDFFKDVNFPLTNLEKPQATPFSYSFYINSEKLKD
jgi:Tfp pilus assembly protein PilN